MTRSTAATIARLNSPPPPARSAEQRDIALASANAVRYRRAAVKLELKYSRDAPALARQKAVALLLDPPAEFKTMKIIDLLVAVPGIGPVKAARIFKAAGVSRSKTFAGVTERQRDEIIAGLQRGR